MSYPRVGDFGPLGASLVPVLERSHDEVERYASVSDSSLAIQLESDYHRLSSYDPMLPIAISLLVLEFPLQLPQPDVNTNLLLFAALSTPVHYLRVKLPKFRGGSGRLQYERELRQTFPYKSDPAARTKCSVDLSRLVISASRIFSPTFVKNALRLRLGATYDQAVASLIYAVGLQPAFGNRAATIAERFVSQPDLAKGLSGALKALGCNSTHRGALLTEANTLQGRGVGNIDLQAEADYRCIPERVAEKVINVPEVELRRHVRDLISAELKYTPEFEDTETWWSRRWQWCVNGTENSLSDRALRLDSKRWVQTHTRAYRKMAAEALTTDPTEHWDGVTLVSVSPKLEHGKTRAIFACDTLSYFAFTRLLDPVQKAWANRRILLDPGGRGSAFLARKINHGRSAGGVNLMLDYDDFNSQHTTRAMQIVFEELGALVHYPDSSLKVLVDSFDRTFISKPDGTLGRSAGTLMSGHRGTTFINSILNAAYIRWALGAQRFDSSDTMHTGDDVYILTDTLPDALDILRKCRNAGCRMNPSKQSLGRHSAEFLRCAVGPHGAYGYLARAIGAISCGSWLSPSPTIAYEGLRNGMSTVRSLINRSGSSVIARIIADAWKDRTYAHCLFDLFSGNASLDGSPVFTNSTTVRTYTAIPLADPARPPPIPIDWGDNASRDYLTHHTSTVEATALSLSHVSPLPMLVLLSHQRGLRKPTELGLGGVRVARGPDCRPRGHVYMFDLYTQKSREGVLEKYPLINLVSNRLESDDLRTLVGLAGGDPFSGNIREEAFGASCQTHRIDGVLPYSDAAALSKVATAGVIHSSFNVFL